MKHQLNIINNTKKDIKGLSNIYANVMNAACDILKIKDVLVMSVSFVSPYMIRKYNREYRNIDRVTDVISFAMEDSFNYVYNNEREIGDIFICYQKAEVQARKYGHSLKRELVFLFTHGLLHLLGYDHMNKEDEKKMFALQDKILAKVGVGRWNLDQ